MKASQFNVFFMYEGARIGANTYTGEYIIIEPTLYDLYEVGLKKNDFSELEEIHPDFYNFLVEQGFFVERDADEFELVKEISQKVDSNDSMYQLTINPTMNCNFKCWYCYETHIKDSKMDENTITATMNFAKNVIENQPNLKRFVISFFGGEPLLYFDKVIKPILTSVSAFCEEKKIMFSSGMTTNGLLINQQMLEICGKYGLNGFQITLDGNRERHDKVRFISEGRGSYDKIVSNIKLVAKNNLYAHVRINCSTETMDGIAEIISEFDDMSKEEKQYINFDIHKVWQVSDNIDDAMDDTRFLFRDKGFAVRGGIYDTVLNSCYADKKNHATINYNGEVFKCTARDFKSEGKEGDLNDDGTITWNEKYSKRLNSKFKNAPCKVCKILPLCGGGCSQQAIEHENIDYCVHDFDEDAKTKIVLNKFIETLTYESKIAKATA